MAAENYMVKLVSNDGVEFEIRRNAIRRAGTIDTLIIDLELDNAEARDQPIPLPLVKSDTLRRVIEFCNHHEEDPIITTEDELENWVIPDWDKNFVDIDQAPLIQLIVAANNLAIKCLIKAACKHIADMARGRSVEGMRRIFNIVNDYTPEEEEELRKENAWCESL